MEKKGHYKHIALLHILRFDWQELVAMANAFWLRRLARRRILKRLAEDCCKFGPLLRQRSVELRAKAAQERLAMLKSGDVAGYNALLVATKESRLREILEETERILAELGPDGPCASKAVRQPAMLQSGNLMPHQLQGLQWLSSMVDRNLSGILADDMGLGKTVQILSLLAWLLETRAERGPHLIIVPMSLLSHWVDELLNWVPGFKYVVYRGSNRKLARIAATIQRTSETEPLIVLTTFETIVHHPSFPSSFPWHCLVVDEGHRLKNFNTQFSKQARLLHCRHRIVLTGTPLQNSLRELWSLLSFVAPKAFAEVEEFEHWFALPPPPSVCLASGKTDDMEDEPGEQDMSKVLSQEEELLIIQRLHGVLRPFLLRRTKELVLRNLPPKREVVIWVPMSAWQRSLYRLALRRIQASAKQGSKHLPTLASSAGSTMRLRKATNHPYQFLGLEAVDGRSPEDIYRASGKFEVLDRLLPRLVKFGHKVLIFSQMLNILDLLEALVARHQLRFCRLDGHVSIGKRRAAVQSFTRDPEVSIFLLSTRAGGLGLNLQAADTVILFDSDWNPQADLQAMDRCHRLGQDKPVLVIRLLTPTALDRGLFERSCKKLEMERKVIGAGQFHAGIGAKAADGPRGAVLKKLLEEAKMPVAASKAITTPEEINAMVARSPEERAAFDEDDMELIGGQPLFSVETVIGRLEKSGRLMMQDEVPGLTRSLKRKLTKPQKVASKGSKPAKKEVNKEWWRKALEIKRSKKMNK